MEMKVCQSCGMPLTAAEHYGTNKDGSKNTDYCAYCFKDGAFVKDMTMEQMIDVCVSFPECLKDEKGAPITKEAAAEMMRAYFPTLKRWKKQ